MSLDLRVAMELLEGDGGEDDERLAMILLERARRRRIQRVLTLAGAALAATDTPIDRPSAYLRCVGRTCGGRNRSPP